MTVSAHVSSVYLDTNLFTEGTCCFTEDYNFIVADVILNHFLEIIFPWNWRHFGWWGCGYFCGPLNFGDFTPNSETKCKVTMTTWKWESQSRAVECQTRWPTRLSRRHRLMVQWSHQGCHALIKTKFPVFSLCSCHFPCVFLSIKN